MWARSLGMLLVLSVLSGGDCAAAETVEVQVEHDDDGYHIYFQILLEAPTERVRDVLTDYPRLHELSPSVIQSDMLSGTAGGEAELDIVLKPCVWFLCRTMRKVSKVSINAYGAIVYLTIPDRSDFDKGREQVIVKRGTNPGTTRVIYNASLAPKFFVPPLIGPWLIRKHVAQNLAVSSQRVEARANE